LVIAELSANHNRQIELALEIIRAAAAAGARMIKFQHYTPDTITVRSPLPEFKVSGGTLWDGTELYDLYAQAMTPWEWTADLVALCDELGVGWFSSPFDASAVDFLEGFDIPAYKVASFEIVDLPLIEYMAQTGKPLVISTGMATLDEIDRAVEAANRGGCSRPILLRCNSAYPAEPSEMDLAAIPFMRNRYGCEVGLSDHTIGSTAAVTAVGLGATVFEKHVTLTRDTDGADSAFSADSDEFTAFVTDVTTAWRAIGTPRFGPSSKEMASLAFRRSLRATRRIAAGEVIGPNDIRSMRPAGGLAPDAITSVIGRRVLTDLEVGQAITRDVIGIDSD
jgi:N-acetylneuraminate synthase